MWSFKEGCANVQGWVATSAHIFCHNCAILQTQFSHTLFLGTHIQQLKKPILATDLAPCRSRKQNFKSVASCSSSDYKPTSKMVAWNDSVTVEIKGYNFWLEIPTSVFFPPFLAWWNAPKEKPSEFWCCGGSRISSNWSFEFVVLELQKKYNYLCNVKIVKHYDCSWSCEKKLRIMAVFKIVHINSI